MQIFEVGTGSMIAAGKATKQVWELVKETDVAIDPNAYIPAVRGYYSLADGRMASMPFNSSTAMMWYSKDAFRKAGLDPDRPPATWPEVVQAHQGEGRSRGADDQLLLELDPARAVQCAARSAVRQQGGRVRGARCRVADQQKGACEAHAAPAGDGEDGTFKYAGRDNQPDQLLVSGKAGIHFNSSGMRGDMVKSAKFDWGEALLPYDPELIATPLNSIIGGASLWTMAAPGRTPDEFKAVATFLQFIGRPENDAYWHQHTGYVPVTFGGFTLSQRRGSMSGTWAPT